MALTDSALDAALDVVALATRVDVCTSDPGLTYGNIAGSTVGNYTLTAGDGNGDWVIADGDTSGRKLTLQAQSGNNGTGTGAANFLAFSNGTDTVYYTCAGDGDTVNSGSAFTIAATNILELRDPA